MAPDLQKHYENQFDMMASEGWKDLLEDFRELKAGINDVTLTTDTQNLFFRKGQLDILDLILKRKEMYEKAYEELTETEQPGGLR